MIKWKYIYRYEPFLLKDIISGKIIKVPQFQRNVVWNTKKRKDFIENLRDGNPFGSILVHQKSQEYTLVDGLQRVSTIKHYYNNPYLYFEYTDINRDMIISLIEYSYSKKNLIFEQNSEAVTQKCIAIQKGIFNKLTEKIEDTDICFEIPEENDLVNDKVSFKIISKTIQDFKEKINISSLVVPTIIYTGPSEKLPTIFYNLNTGGVNLSKYETFSSLWNPKKFILDDEEINAKIYEKYEQMMNKSNLEIDISLEEIVEKGVSLFEYCYSISEILRDKNKKYNLIFGPNKKSTDPIGFEILSLISGLNVNKAENLDKKLIAATPQFLIQLKEIIVEAFSVITESLEPWIKAENGTNNTLDSTYMIYHMAVSYIKHNFQINFENYHIVRISDSNWNKNFKKYLPLHYIKDYLNDFWKRNRQVSDLSREVNSPESLNKYATNISPNEWNEVLQMFKENQIYETGTTISLKSKLFLDYLIKYKLEEKPELRKYLLSNNDNSNIKIDYEHIIPQKRIETNIKGLFTAKTFPISSLGNLCYLSSNDNRSKKDKTIYEYIENRPSYITDKEYLNLINYPTKEELRFIDYSTTEFEIEYKKFINTRIDYLIKEFKEYVIKKY